MTSPDARRYFATDGSIFAILPGLVTREVAPASWQWPERMAARTLDLPRWEAGQRMMQSAAPDAFANIAAGDRIVTANREALEACRKQANRTLKAARCMITIAAEERRKR